MKDQLKRCRDEEEKGQKHCKQVQIGKHLNTGV